MKFRSLIIPLLALFFLGMAHKPPCSIRFYTVANKRDGASFIRAVKIGDPPKTIYVSKMAAIGEGDIVSVYPFPAEDGTFGCGLKLTYDGTLRLDTISTENRGQSMICVVNGRLITAMMIDRPIKDGVLFIGSGLKQVDVEVIKKHFHVMGKKKGKKEQSDAIPEVEPPPLTPDTAAPAHARE